jgi:hypothetical protein
MIPSDYQVKDGLEVSDLLKETKCNFLVYYGNNYGEGFDELPQEFAKKAKIIRRKVDFDYFMKLFRPYEMINPLKESCITFDLPYIYHEDKIIARWKPIFDRELKPESLSTISEGSIIKYTTQTEIFISLLTTKRHTAALNSETLLIDKFTNTITREFSVAEPNKYVTCKQHTENGSWVTDMYDEQEISGYKLR